MASVGSHFKREVDFVNGMETMNTLLIGKMMGIGYLISLTKGGNCALVPKVSNTISSKG